MIADMLSNKNPEQIVTELFTKGRKSGPSHAFITQSFFFSIPRNTRYTLYHYENSKQTRISRNRI